jgi:hypothetical protein
MNWIGRIAVFVAATVTVCNAQTTRILWPPPRIDWPADLPRPTIPNEMIGKLRVANMPIVLEETRLRDAQKRLGGTIGHRGDAGDAEAWLCLHGVDAKGSWILWLTSGEIDGPAIGGFQWKRLALDEIPDRRCRLIPREMGGIELPLALHPGMTEAEVRKTLGRPTLARGRELIFWHEHQEVIQGISYTSDNTVGVNFNDGIATEVDVVKTISN